MSTTSEAGDEAWCGDVHDGVTAWTRRAGLSHPTDAGRGARSSGDEPRDRRSRRTRPEPSGRRTKTGWPAPADPVALGPDTDPESVARTILLDQLTGRARSRSELADKLASKGVPDDVATRLLDRFEEVGLVDDDAFARAWVSGRQSGKGLARRAIAQELRRKGIDEEVAREVLAEVDPADEEQAARVLVRRKLRSVARVDDTTATRRLVAMLARKGYGAGVAYAVVREELADAEREAPEREAPEVDVD